MHFRAAHTPPARDTLCNREIHSVTMVCFAWERQGTLSDHLRINARTGLQIGIELHMHVMQAS
jgi:hypothetical protein